MIYNVFKKFLFIHVPRCSGTSMTRVLHSHFPMSFVEDLVWKHATASQIHSHLIKDDWDDYFKFAVLRSPWEIIESFWRHTSLRAYEAIDDGVHVADAWKQEMEEFKTYKSFSEYVEKRWLTGIVANAGGFFRAYCCIGGKDAGVVVYQYSKLLESWKDIQKRLRIEESAYPVLNRADCAQGVWTEELIARVGDVMHNDVTRFGYSPPQLR